MQLECVLNFELQLFNDAPTLSNMVQGLTDRRDDDDINEIQYDSYGKPAQLGKNNMYYLLCECLAIVV